MPRGAVEEIKRKQLRDQVGHLIDIPREQDRHKRKPPKRGTHASKKARKDAPSAKDAAAQNAKRPPAKRGVRRTAGKPGPKGRSKPGAGR